MSSIDINSQEFTASTQLKLDIFREFFKEWYPVFLYNNDIDKIYIYDMFAGSGSDIVGNEGSPLILLEEVIKQSCPYAQFNQHKYNKKVCFGFNEYEKVKCDLLKETVSKFFSECKAKCGCLSCGLSDNVFTKNEDFENLKDNEIFCRILENNKYAKFVLLDQYGFKHIDDDTFLWLVNSPKTDFIFFIASSFVHRFKTTPCVQKYFKGEKFSESSDPKQIHRDITEHFRQLIPKNKEYYIHSFTIQKDSNYYGLIFGSGHTYGMEKFLKVCWNKDASSGESNCNIDNDFREGELFFKEGQSIKRDIIKSEIKDKILDGHIKNNIQGLKYAISKGCLPILYVQAVDDLVENKKIKIVGHYNKTSQKIHTVKPYSISVL